MRILLIGGNGYIGKSLKKKFIDAGNEVFTLGRSNSNDFKYDLTQELELKEKPKDIDTVIHLAGVVHNKKHANSFYEPTFKTDVLIHKNVLKLLNILNPINFVFLSSVAIYGKDGGVDICESDLVRSPFNSYGRSKFVGENLFLNQENKNLKVTILRLPMVITLPELNGNLKTLSILAKKKLLVGFDFKTAERSYILDFELSQILLNLNLIPGGIYNVKNGETRLSDLIEIFIEHYNKHYRLSYKQVYTIKLFGKLFLSLGFKQFEMYSSIIFKPFTINSSKIERYYKLKRYSDRELQKLFTKS